MEKKKLTEKERYTWFACGCCVDNQDNLNIVNCIERLNQQDKRIKELEALTRELNLDFEQAKERLQALQNYYTESMEMLDDERKRILSKLDSDEGFSLQTYRSLCRTFNENILKIELFSQFVHDLHMLEVEL